MSPTVGTLSKERQNKKFRETRVPWTYYFEILFWYCIFNFDFFVNYGIESLHIRVLTISHQR